MSLRKHYRKRQISSKKRSHKRSYKRSHKRSHKRHRQRGGEGWGTIISNQRKKLFNTFNLAAGLE